MRNVSRPEAEMLNEWLGPIFMSERRMSVKFAVAAVLVLHLPFGAERSANSIAMLATEHYLPNHIDLSPSSAGSILKILARHGLVSFRNNRNGRVWWRAV
jgi:hypothetical protein